MERYETEFRAEIAAFLDHALTPELREAGRRATSVFIHPDISLRWQRILDNKGWAAPDWPVEYGGTGWTEMERYVFAAECAAAGAPNLAPMGLKMVAPVIMHYGTDAQKAHFLPRILSGEDYWCQGFSEPDSGSDLASLKLRAIRDGGDYVLNGSKIWTTHAQFATHMFALVRTSSEGKPQQGITFLLLDMKSPGIQIDPILSMSGEHELNQVFFDDVRVPIANRLSHENDGWSVAKYLLGHERGGKYAPALIAYLEQIRQAVADSDRHGDPVLALRIAREHIALLALQALELKAMYKGDDPAMPSILKILGTERSQRLDHIAVDVAGPAGLLHPRENDPGFASIAVPRYLNNRAASIYAGSNEIQRDLIAKAVLGA